MSKPHRECVAFKDANESVIWGTAISGFCAKALCS